MKAFALAVLAGYATAAGARADILEHLGAPPPGVAWVQLESTGSITPIQIAGTTSPPTAVVNGKPLKLEETPEPEPGPALKINGRAREVTGTTGRFFVQLSPKESAIPTLEITIRSAAGKTFRATLPVGHFFLDGPIHVRRTIEPGERPRNGFELLLPGALPPGATLVLENGVVAKEGVSVKVPEGKSHLIGKLTHADGSARSISVPVTVTATEHDPVRPIFSLAPPLSGSIRGITNAGALVLLEGQPVKIEGDGSFETKLPPRQPPWDAEFRVTHAGVREKSYTVRIDAAPEEPAQPSRWAIGRFRAGAFALFQGLGGSSYTGELEWHPTFRLNPWLATSAYANMALPKKSAGGVVSLLGYGARVAFGPFARLRGTGFELGGGAQTWSGYGGTFGQIGASATWTPDAPFLRGRLEHLRLGNSVAVLPGDLAYQLHADVGFRLF